MSSQNGTIELKVGELARRAGVSVRTLHHYEQVVLLAPSSRSEGRHRLYGGGDIARLQQIRSLRHIGLSLDEIRRVLANPEMTFRRVLSMHVDRLREQIVRQRDLLRRLERLARGRARSTEVPVPELLHALEGIALAERYFTPQQRAWIAARARRLGPSRIEKAQRDWATLLADVRASMARGDDPASPAVRRLARRWSALLRSFTGGDAGIGNALREKIRNEPVLNGNDTREWRAMCAYLTPEQSTRSRGRRASA
jgi:MerR family transcriptional regulator, thiopeptide resistance regulator